MKNRNLILIILFPILFFSCIEKEKKENDSINKEVEKIEKVERVENNIDLKEIESNFLKWWTYHNNNITLSSNFKGLNVQSDTINKNEFLKQLTSSNFIPVKIPSNNKYPVYKLYKLSPNADMSIRNTIKNESLTYLNFFNMEGLAFPKFNFTDLDGKVYTNENTRGKTLIIKTWFINCKACVAEFPELNKLVEKYNNDKEVIFISLALDEKNKLIDFLKRKDFKYKVVPNQEEFITKKLDLYVYPTHIIINKNGVITKVVNKASEMITFFENEKTSK